MPQSQTTDQAMEPWGRDIVNRQQYGNNNTIKVKQLQYNFPQAVP